MFLMICEDVHVVFYFCFGHFCGVMALVGSEGLSHPRHRLLALLPGVGNIKASSTNDPRTTRLYIFVT